MSDIRQRMNRFRRFCKDCTNPADSDSDYCYPHTLAHSTDTRLRREAYPEQYPERPSNEI
jgi:hypothetical protein